MVLHFQFRAFFIKHTSCGFEAVVIGLKLHMTDKKSNGDFQCLNLPDKNRIIKLYFMFYISLLQSVLGIIMEPIVTAGKSQNNDQFNWHKMSKVFVWLIFRYLVNNKCTIELKPCIHSYFIYFLKDSVDILLYLSYFSLSQLLRKILVSFAA